VREVADSGFEVCMLVVRKVASFVCIDVYLDKHL